jgi:hypothetical protein
MFSISCTPQKTALRGKLGAPVRPGICQISAAIEKEKAVSNITVQNGAIQARRESCLNRCNGSSYRRSGPGFRRLCSRNRRRRRTRICIDHLSQPFAGDALAFALIIVVLVVFGPGGFS